MSSILDTVNPLSCDRITFRGVYVRDRIELMSHWRYSEMTYYLVRLRPTHILIYYNPVCFNLGVF